MQKEINWLLQEKYHGKVSWRFKKDIERLKRGEPLDYVIGFTEFLGCKIDLSKKPLIPRSETEYWAEKVIDKISSDFQSFEYQGIRDNPSTRYARSGQNLRILDIFAGSGCIGLAALKRVKNSRVTFAEKNKNLLKQIKMNCNINNIKPERYQIILSDVFANIKGTFDYIFANPPYIATARKSKIQTAVLDYEPKTALLGGRDGLLYIRKFLDKAQKFFKKKGRIYMEFDYIQKKEIEKIIKKNSYKHCKFYKDQYGKWRWVVVE